MRRYFSIENKYLELNFVIFGNEKELKIVKRILDFCALPCTDDSIVCALPNSKQESCPLFTLTFRILRAKMPYMRTTYTFAIIGDDNSIHAIDKYFKDALGKEKVTFITVDELEKRRKDKAGIEATLDKILSKEN